MKVNSEKQGTNVVLLDLEVETEKAIRAYEQTCRQLSHQVNVPGFRKGKAPRNIIEKNLGADYIKRETLEHLVPELLEQAITLEKLEPITEPQISSYEFELGQPLKLQAKLEVRPEVTVGLYRGVKVTVAQGHPTDDAVEHALKNIAESLATLTEVGPRPVAMQDTVIIDFECTVDGNLVEGGKTSGMVLEMKENSFLEGFCEQLVGAEPGQKKEIKVKFPGHYRNVSLAGKDAVFQVEIKGIRDKVVPEINDQMAAAAGAESLEKLQEMIKQQLAEEVRKDNQARVQRAVIDAVVSGAQVEVPDTMIEREKTVLLNQLRSLIERSGSSWAEYTKTSEFASTEESRRVEAKQRVLTSLVLGAIVRAENLSISEEELTPYISEVTRHYNVPAEKITENPQAKQRLMEEALIDKVVEYLVNNAEVKYEPELTLTPEAAAK